MRFLKYTTFILVSTLLIVACNKENPEPNNPQNSENLNGIWIESNWSKVYAHSDSIFNSHNWVTKDTLENRINWILPNDETYYLSTSLTSDSAWFYYDYVGDGYNNNVTTVHTTADSYNFNDVVSVDGISYTIHNHPEYESMDDDYRYVINLVINNVTDGCKEYLQLFKRKDD